MDKQKILNEIEKTKEHLANMEKMLEECNGEEWEPRHFEPYYYVNSYGQVQFTVNNNTLFDEVVINVLNAFKTKEEAKRESEKILVRRHLEDIARRLNEGKGINWSEYFSPKYYLSYSMAHEKIELHNEGQDKHQGTVYCLDKNFLDVAAQEIGKERLKKYLSGE